jgi:hypothetical protein
MHPGYIQWLMETRARFCHAIEAARNAIAASLHTDADHF